MNQKTAKKLRKLCRRTSYGTPTRNRYQDLKDNWNNVPAPSRHKLLEALERSAKIIESSSNP